VVYRIGRCLAGRFAFALAQHRASDRVNKGESCRRMDLLSYLFLSGRLIGERDKGVSIRVQAPSGVVRKILNHGSFC